MTKVERGTRGRQLSESKQGVRKNARPADGSARRGGKAGRKPSKTATIVMSLIEM
jgi:hypothetical protein